MKNHILFFASLLAMLSACKNAPEKDEKTTPVNAAASSYDEQHRPQFHFSPPTNWMNDPNGLVFFEGEYHLFYQHYPDSNVWGPMHWGHAVSTDLLRWENLPIALFPDSLGYIFSGSAVVDSNNTSGFGKSGKPPLVAMYTYHKMEWEKAGRKDFQYQGIAYSNDKGRTWTKYEGNPVIPSPHVTDFRDPKVFWHEPSKLWVMVLAESTHIGIFNSPDLKKWQKVSEFGKQEGWHGDEKSDWECPDLFELKILGESESHWVMLVSVNPGAFNGGSGTQYFIGKFDGKTFVNENKPETVLWLDYGWDNYAGVTWSNATRKADKESRLFLGWMSNWLYSQQVPTKVWRSAMTLPRDIKLKKTAAGLRLISSPVEELTALRNVTYVLDTQEIAGNLDLSGKLGFSPSKMEAVLEVEFPAGAKTDFSVALSNTKGEEYRIGFDATSNQFYSDRTKAGKQDFSDKFATQKHFAPRLEKGNLVRFHVFFDVASAELFADWGATTMTETFFPNEDYNQLKLYAEKGKARLRKAEFIGLKSIWQR